MTAAPLLCALLAAPPAAGPVAPAVGTVPVAPAPPPAVAGPPVAAGHEAVGVWGPRRPRLVAEVSMTHISLPPPRVIAVHDILTILVDEKSEVAVRSRFDRRRNLTLDADIGDWVRLADIGRLFLGPATTVGELTGGLQLQNDGRGIDTEAVRYRIAAEVVDVLPNGNLVLEARKTIVSNRDRWEYTLTGTIPAEKVNRDLTAVSEDVAALTIEKRSAGRIPRSSGRGWAVRIIDAVWPL